MAAPTIDQIMLGVETRLKTIPGLRTSPYLAEQINPPQAIISAPHAIDYHLSFGRGKVSYELQVTVVVSKVIDRVGMKALTSYANVSGANSIITAIEGDKTLGALVDDCTVDTGPSRGSGFTMLTKEQADGLGFFGGVWNLFILAQGS